MTLIRPFAGLRPQPQYAEQVVAPPYDVLNTQEAREQAQGRPWSFLHISKPEIDLASNVSPYDDAVYAKGAENLKKMMHENILIQDKSPCYYCYQLQMGKHIQTGLVAAASVPAYLRNKIIKHEFTRPDKEDDRVKQIDALNAQTGPVFLTYRHQDQVSAIMKSVCAKEPVYNLTAADGIRHTFWVIDDQLQVESITRLFDGMENLYIADGHHRSAAAGRIAQMRNANENDSANYFLSVIFPDNEMQILDYNRVVKDLNGLSETEVLAGLEKNFQVNKIASQTKPATVGEFMMYLNKQWYRLTIKPELIPADDPVKRLDVSLLMDYVLNPMFAITDPRTDKRIDFVGGIRGLQGLEKRVDSGEMSIAFALYPTSLHDLMAVADADQVMPPKSTWFEPKLADGLVSHVLD